MVRINGCLRNSQISPLGEDILLTRTAIHCNSLGAPLGEQPRVLFSRWRAPPIRRTLISQRLGAHMVALPSTRAIVVSVPVIVFAQWLLRLYLGYKRIQRRTNYHPGRWAFLSRSTYYWHVAPDAPLFKWGWHARWIDKFKRKRDSQYIDSFTSIVRSSSIL